MHQNLHNKAKIIGGGDAGPHSDVDLVIAWKDQSRARPGALLAKLEDATGRRIDVIRWEQAKKSPRLLNQIVEEGRVIVDRAYAWPRILTQQDTIRARARRHERLMAREAEAVVAELGAPFE